MFRPATVLLKHPGAALAEDFYGARVITLSRPGALNSLTLPAFRDLYKHYVISPHANDSAIYVLRGDGTKAFSAGGDLVALTADVGLDAPAAGSVLDGDYAGQYFRYEYHVDCHIASMKRRQVALWAGHVYGSGVGVSLHGSHRVCFNNTRFAMPEVQLGSVPDVASQHKFARLPIKGLGAYLALTGNTLSGADVLHAGLATHYASLAAYESILHDLKQVRRSQEISDILDTHTAGGVVPPFTMAAHLDVLAKCFHVEADTTVQDIRARLADDGSPFAQSALESMAKNSPTAMCLTLEAFKAHRAARSVVESLKLDYKLIQAPLCLSDFKQGAEARVVHKNASPRWHPATVEEVNLRDVRETLHAPGYDLNLSETLV